MTDDSTAASKLRADLRKQKRKLLQIIAAAVNGLSNLDKLVSEIKALGARHSGYGVTVAVPERQSLPSKFMAVLVGVSA